MALYHLFFTMSTLLIVINDTALGQDCVNNDDCISDRLCANQKCIEPCKAGVCGHNTLCHVRDHVAMCACLSDYSGHPFTGCYPAPPAESQDCEKIVSSKHKKKEFHLHHDIKMSWLQALFHCISLDMRLATLNSEEEHNRLVDQIKEANVKLPGRWWIGGSDLTRTGSFMWMSTGKPIDYHKFPNNQPDNNIYPNGEKEHCMELRTEWGYAWNDYVCEHQQYFACEKGG